MKNKLICGDITLTDANLYGGITFQQETNTENDFMYGVVACASIKFTINNSGNQAESYLGKSFQWFCQMNGETDYSYKGIYIIKDVKKNGKKATLTAYDFISLLDCTADEWLATITFPITLANFVSSMGTKLGLEIQPLTTAYRGNYTVYNNFMARNVSYRQILEYVAQVANVFYIADTSGTYDITYKRYSNSETAIDNSKYVSLSLSDYEVDSIDKVQIQSTFDDIGYIAGTGENAYVITENPLFFTSDKQSFIQAIASSLLEELSTITYTPMKFSTLQDFGINCGDIITVDGKTCYVMKKTIKESGCQFECVGNKKRDSQKTEVNSAITALNNKTNELVRNVDETKSTLTEVKGSMEIITDEQGNIKSQMATLTTDVSEVKQTAQGLTSEVSSVKTTLNNLDGEVTTLESEVNTVKQTSNSLSSEITSVKNTVDSQNGKITAVEEKTAEMELTVAGFNTKLTETQTIANNASNKADKADANATNALEKTSELKQTIDSFSVKLESVETTANSASTKADNASSKADTANTNAETAVTKTSKLEQDLDGFELRVSNTEKSIDTITGEQTTIKDEQAKLKLSVDEFGTKLSSVENTANGTKEEVSTLKQTVDGFEVRVSDTETSVNEVKKEQASLKLTVDGFSTRINSAETNAESAVTKVSSLEQTVDGFEANISAIEKTADEASTKATSVKATVDGLTVSTSSSVSGKETKTTLALKSGSTTISSSSWTGTTATQATTIAADAVKGITLSATNGDTSSTLTLKSGSTTLSSANIKFTGLVSFSDLSTSGKTTINGANITTGKISADRIDVDEISFEVVKQGSKTVIDCSTSGKIYIGGGSSTGAVDTVYIKGTTVEISKWGTSGGFTFTTGSTSPAMYSTLSNITSLGTSNYPWGDVWCRNLHIKVSSSIYLETNISLSTLQILPKSSCQLGTSSYQFDAVYTKKLYINGTELSSSSSSSSISKLTSGSYTVTLNSSKALVPGTSNQYMLGTSSYYWTAIYAQTLYLYYSSYKYATLACNSSGKLTVNGTAVG